MVIKYQGKILKWQREYPLYQDDIEHTTNSEEQETAYFANVKLSAYEIADSKNTKGKKLP